MEYSPLLEQSLHYLRCPICSALEDLEFSRLAKLQFEVTNDSVLRKHLASEGGFCAFHFNRFRKLANIHTNALMLQALYESWQMSPYLQFGAQCFVCRESEAHETQLLSSIATLLSDESFILRFRSGPGFCFEHLRSVSSFITEPSLTLLLSQVQQERLEQLMHTVDKMVHTSYFELMALERRSIPCVIEKFVGRRALGL